MARNFEVYQLSLATVKINSLRLRMLKRRTSSKTRWLGVAKNRFVSQGKETTILVLNNFSLPSFLLMFRHSLLSDAHDRAKLAEIGEKPNHEETSVPSRRRGQERIRLSFDDQQVDLTLCASRGTERVTGVAALWSAGLTSMRGALLLYDAASQRSADRVKRCLKGLILSRQRRKGFTGCIVIAVDSSNVTGRDPNSSAIPLDEEAVLLAEKANACFVHTSARKAIGVEEAILCILKLIIRSGG